MGKIDNGVGGLKQPNSFNILKNNDLEYNLYLLPFLLRNHCN